MKSSSDNGKRVNGITSMINESIAWRQPRQPDSRNDGAALMVADDAGTTPTLRNDVGMVMITGRMSCNVVHDASTYSQP